MDATHLNTRSKKILAALLRSHIATGEAVSSQRICREYDLGVSSATVRHTLAELEGMGLLRQPHTSSGRVPTEAGYRYYVNSLMPCLELDEKKKEKIRKEYQKEKIVSVEELLQKTGKVLAASTRCVAMVRFPRLQEAFLKELKLIPLSSKKILVVLVTSSGLIRDAAVALEEVVEEELLRINRFLNAEVVGHKLSEIQTFLSHLGLEERDHFFYLRQRALAIIRESHLFEEEEKICLEGLGSILEEPEYQNPLRLRMVMEVLEKKKHLCEILDEEPGMKEVRVQIGRENAWEEMEDLSMVMSPYWVGEETVGRLGVVGPMRMAYPEVISAVRYVAEALSNCLSDEKEKV